MLMSCGQNGAHHWWQWRYRLHEFQDDVQQQFPRCVFADPESLALAVQRGIAQQANGIAQFQRFAAVKAALRSLAQTPGLELARFNAIGQRPPPPSFDRFGLPDGGEPAIRAEIQQKSLIQRFGATEEIAKVALCLATEVASYIVGQELVVDSGMALL